jgi:hypothetical protein
MSEELVTIYRFRGSAEANLWKEKLYSSGIHAIVVNDVFTGAATPSFELQVRGKDLDKARKILKPLKNTNPFKISWASIAMLFIFGIIALVGGIFLFVYSRNSGVTDLSVASIIMIIFGGAFLLLPLTGILKRNRSKKL